MRRGAQNAIQMPHADLLGFDEALYLQRYDDVAQGVACGEWPSGYAHYCAVGRSQGRCGSPEVDERWYQTAYPSARLDVEAGWAKDISDHYLRIGRQRGYLPNKKAPRVNNPAGFRSCFGGLWVDQANALDLVRGRLELGTITSEQAALLFKWIANGYVVIEKAVPDEILDGALTDVTKAYEGGYPSLKFNVTRVGKNLSWVPETRTNATKALDLHWISEPIRDAIFCDKLLDFLHLIFERRALATQTLSFWRGSAQDAHQDSAYVNYSLPMQFAASWIALEDVREGAGELFYHVGGQRMPEYLYRGRYKGVQDVTRLDPESDVQEAIKEHVQSIRLQSQGMSLETEPFLARRGDVLFWSADLPHGGKPISATFTRKSVVTHYCPSEVVPAYFEGSGKTEIRRHREKAYYSSGQYGARIK
jgi:phytanoyl-CoA hydroxylase